MNELEILNFTLEAFFSSLDKVTCADDFLVESLNLGSPTNFHAKTIIPRHVWKD